MINFTSRSFIPAAQSVAKVAPGADASTDSSKTAAAAPAPAANQGSAKSGGNQSFQSLLNAQADGGGAAQTQNPLLAELPAAAVSDDDTVQTTALGGRGRTSAKSEDPAAAPAPVDLASLIGAAAGQAILPPAPVTVQRPGTAVPTGVTGATPAKTPLMAALAAGADASAQEADAAAERAVDDEKSSLANATALNGEPRTKAQTSVDPATLSSAQQAPRDVDTAPQPRLERVDTAFAVQNAALSHVAMPVAENHAPSAPAVAPSISTPVGAEGWDQALGQRVVWMVAQRNPTAEIHVNPPNLGPVSVTVNVDNNTANATFVAAHAATRDAINDAMPHLKEMLAGSGITLGQVTVSAESFSHGGGANAQQAHVPRNGNMTAATGSDAAAVLVSPVRTVPAPQGLVDTFA
jgi:flagellar hook-length control protein FliK